MDYEDDEDLLYYIGPPPENVSEADWILVSREYPDMDEEEKLEYLGRCSNRLLTRLSYGCWDRLFRENLL